MAQGYAGASNTVPGILLRSRRSWSRVRSLSFHTFCPIGIGLAILPHGGKYCPAILAGQTLIPLKDALQEGWISGAGAMLAAIGILVGAWWKREKDQDDVKLKAEHQAFEHVTSLLERYRKELDLIREGRDAMEKRIDQLECRVDELERENKILRFWNGQLLAYLRKIGAVIPESLLEAPVVPGL